MVTDPTAIRTPMRKIVRATLFTATIALGAMIALAPATNAQTEKEIQAGCDQANGDYDSYQDNLGNTISWCCYKDNEGKAHCDKFENGLYILTDDTRKAPPVYGPVNPPPNHVPIKAPPPAAAVG
jgi:hypothetical protein